MRIKLGIPLTPKEIITATNGQGDIGDNRPIRYISTDSREVCNGDLFIALHGEKFDGENFASDAIENGALVLSKSSGKRRIMVSNTNDALLSIAAFYEKKLPYLLYKIAVTGSVGKTTTKDFLEILLSQKYKVHKSQGNLNNEIGLPLSILSAPKDSELLLMEMGMNHSGEIARLSKCLSPHIGLITNIGTSHIGNLGSREKIAEAKLEIKEGMTEGRLIIPYDEALLRSEREALTFSCSDIKADFYLESEEDSRVSLFYQGKLFCRANFALQEEHFKKCLVSAVAVSIFLGVPKADLISKISSISRDNLRQRLFYIKPFYFYDDSYNASYESILACFDTAKTINCAKVKSLVLGDILELGDKKEDISRRIGENISPVLFKRLYLFGENAPLVYNATVTSGFPKENIYINTDLSNPLVTAEQIKRYCKDGELIILKGSRGVRLERIMSFFT